jgi:hypothetical protein
MLQYQPAAQTHSRACAWGTRNPQLAGRATDNKSISPKEAEKNSSKFTERSGNVYENKEPVSKTWERSWNVTENKDTYLFGPGISLQTNELSPNGRIPAFAGMTEGHTRSK